MSFVMLEKEEILILAQKGINGPAWAIYCALRAHCYLPKKGQPYQVQHFMCFPSQSGLHAFLGWDELKKKPDGVQHYQSKPAQRAVDRLVEHGLVKVYRGKDNSLEARSARRLLKSKFAKTHRNGKGLSGGRQHVYRLVFWEELMRRQKGIVSDEREGTEKERIRWFHSQMDSDANKAEPWLWGLENITPAEDRFRDRYFYWLAGGTL
jgi:predicted transcriptional regulator